MHIVQVSENFEGCMAGNLRAASRLVTRRYDKALREHGLRITQVAVLAQVQRSAPVSITELGTQLATERSVVARDVAILERDGLLTVTVDDSDHRARAVTITTAGARRLRAAAPAWRSAQNELREILGPRLADQLVDLSRRVQAALEDQ